MHKKSKSPGGGAGSDPTPPIRITCNPLSMRQCITWTNTHPKFYSSAWNSLSCLCPVWMFGSGPTPPPGLQHLQLEYIFHTLHTYAKNAYCIFFSLSFSTSFSHFHTHTVHYSQTPTFLPPRLIYSLCGVKARCVHMLTSVHISWHKKKQKKPFFTYCCCSVRVSVCARECVRVCFDVSLSALARFGSVWCAPF